MIMSLRSEFNTLSRAMPKVLKRYSQTRLGLNRSNAMVKYESGFAQLWLERVQWVSMT